MSAKVSVAPVRNEVDYDEALKRIDELFNAAVGTPEFDEFDILTILVHDYEQKHYPIGTPDPAATLRHYLDRMEMAAKELEPYIGTKSAVSMILNGRRPLTVKMIRKLHEGLNIPLTLLLGSTEVDSDSSKGMSLTR
ncbi:MAG: helix-turn-helix domain-containing protein [Fimbriimonas sp.]|nr:helix-turn-helix domain-containing protein [Fimbriimonas sp.]